MIFENSLQMNQAKLHQHLYRLQVLQRKSRSPTTIKSSPTAYKALRDIPAELYKVNLQ